MNFLTIRVSVTIDGPKIERFELMSATDPALDAAARSLFSGNYDELLKLKPFLTIVSNRCERTTLVAYARAWNVAQHGTAITFDQRKYPGAVAPATPRRGNSPRHYCNGH